ncbi:MAG: deoxyribonuclease IV [bacterium]
MRFGFQVSITKTLNEVIKRAVERNCQTLQIFTRNPRRWVEPREFPSQEIKRFQADLKKANITPLIVHLPYLPNLATLDKKLFIKSVEILISDLQQAANLGATYVIAHTGSHLGNGLKQGIRQVVKAVNIALSAVDNEVILLLENQAGAGTEIGYDFSHLKEIIENVTKTSRVGICFDICHAFAAGYELSDIKGVNKTIELFDTLIGIEKLKVIHANDSKAKLGAKIDRHAHIGMGKIGLAGFSAIVNHTWLRDTPVILETPIITIEDDVRNLKVIKSLVK